MYHAHIEVQRMITATLQIVMNREQRKAWKKPVFAIPFT
jgi:hypothetical protein